MIRKAVVTDAIDIYNLEISTFNNHYSLSTIQDDLQNDKVVVFLYEKNDKIVGYISIYYFLDEANLQKVAVLENERRNGVATELIEYSIEYLKEHKVKSFYLEVNEHNLIAIKVYEKLGFKRISTRKNYYGSDSAIIFEKNLI